MIVHKGGLDIVPATLSLADVDANLIDCAPTLALMLVNPLAAADAALIPCKTG